MAETAVEGGARAGIEARVELERVRLVVAPRRIKTVPEGGGGGGS